MIRLSVSFVALLLFTLAGVPHSANAGPPLIAAIEFGNVNVGPPVEKPRGHPSGHAVDHLRPRTVTISQGGTVVFRLPGGVHQVAIYDDGTKARDIDVDGARTGFSNCPGGTDGARFIDDANNRIAVLDDPPCATGDPLVQHTFNEPGRYLVICTFDSHFINFNMFGWVIVK